MQLTHIFMAAIFMTLWTLLGASANISDGLIYSTMAPFTLNSYTTAPSTMTITASTTVSNNDTGPGPGPSPTGIPFFRNCKPCYCEGETWDELGSWDGINRALQDSGIVRVTTIPHGYHVNEKIAVNDHCFIFEIGVEEGNALNMTPQKITDLLSAARTKCVHGGRWNLNFVAVDGDIQGKGWVKTDPQAEEDCS